MEEKLKNREPKACSRCSYKGWVVFQGEDNKEYCGCPLGRHLDRTENPSKFQKFVRKFK